MINSMTGFGSSEMIRNDFEIYCEIKSINHRFNELHSLIDISLIKLKKKGLTFVGPGDGESYF